MNAEAVAVHRVLMAEAFLKEAVRMLLSPVPWWAANSREDREQYVRDCLVRMETACAELRRIHGLELHDRHVATDTSTTREAPESPSHAW